MKNKKPFKLPKAFLNQLNEYTNGYYLVTVNENMEFETHFNFPNELVQLGIINHIDIESSDFQEMLRHPFDLDFEESDDEEDEGLDGTKD